MIPGGLALQEKEVVAGAGVSRELANGHAQTGSDVLHCPVLDNPPGLREGVVDALPGDLLRARSSPGLIETAPVATGAAPGRI
jgi:hypothetical protein